MNKDTVLFLDIDGVLNGRSWFKSPFRKLLKGKNSEPSKMICRRNLFWLGLLCYIKRPKVILTSCWRYFWNTDGSTVNDRYIEADKLLRKYGVNISGKICNYADGLCKHEYNKELLDDFVRRYNNLNFSDKDGKREIKTQQEILAYARGSQILKWIEDNNYSGNYIILEDDWSDVIVYKELEDHIIITKYYGLFPGFRVKHFIKALRILK